MGDRLERDIGMAFVILVGLAFMAGGGYGEYVALSQKPIDKTLAWTFLGVAVFGALLLPSVFAMAFPRVKSIWVMIFPGGLPLIGGRGASDPQPPPASETPPNVPFPPPGGGQ